MSKKIIQKGNALLVDGAYLLKGMGLLATISLLTGIVIGLLLARIQKYDESGNSPPSNQAIAEERDGSVAETKKSKNRPLTASWYSTAETTGVCADGSPLDDGALTCASWDYPFGTVLRVRHTITGKSVDVTVTDRGPARRFYREGRVIDLTKAAFSAIADLDLGIIPITIERIRHED